MGRSEESKEQIREYRQSPEYKEKRKASDKKYREKSKTKEQRKQYEEKNRDRLNTAAKERSKNMSPEAKKKRKESQKRWRENHREKYEAYKKEYRQRPEVQEKSRARKQTPEYKAYMREYRNRPGYSEKKKRWRYLRKVRVLTHYSKGDVPKCVCCGEETLIFLTIDHINGGGRQHHKEITGEMYGWIERNDYPSMFQTLCMNCNYGKHQNGGTCPHQEQLKAA